jgi:hypothetical protein
MDSETRAIIKLILEANTMIKVQKGSQVSLHVATSPVENQTREAKSQRRKGGWGGT